MNLSILVKLLKKALMHVSQEPQKNGIDHLKPLRLLAEQGAWVKLEEAGRKLLLQHPPQYDAIELVAYSLQQGGRLEATAVIAEQATKPFPSSWMFHFLAGVALKGIGREKEACKYLRQALVILPTDRQTVRQLIEAIAAVDGIDLAASEYAAHCHKMRTHVDITVAPISMVRDWAQTVGLPLLEAGEVEEIPFKAPHVWGHPPATDVVYALSNKPYVAEIKDARIFSNSSLVLTSDGTVLSDTGGHPKFGRFVSFAYEAVVLAQQPDKVLLNFSEFNTREIEAGILLSGLASSAFGHWLPEFLPKLQFLQRHPDFANLPIIVDAGMPQSHFDHLRRLASNQLILLQANESLICRRLLVAPSPAFSPVETFPNDIPMHELPGLSPRAMRYLRAGESNVIQQHRHRRIFLARKNMKWRRLLNENEIVSYLKSLGFESIFTEEMSVVEQITLFQQAQWIVAPNGSALLNLIFADTSTKLLVLTQPNLHNWGTFQGPMDALGYQSLCVRGDYALAEDQKHSDYHIPLERIRDALSYLGINKVCHEHKF
jgi:Glycosyltransferase 61